MSRGLADGQVAATIAPHRQIVPLVEMYFDSGTLMCALGPWDFISSAGTYVHTGPLAYIKAASETAGSQDGLEVGMSGLDMAAVQIATTEPYRGRLLRLLKGYLDPGSNLGIGQPVPWFVGRMVSMTITDDNTQAAIAIIAEHYEIELSRPAPTRWSDSDQQRLFPGDLGCQYAAATATKQVIWPSRQAQGG